MRLFYLQAPPAWDRCSWALALLDTTQRSGETIIANELDALLTRRDVLQAASTVELGNPNYACDLAPIDFTAFAKACGADGFRCVHPAEVKDSIRATLNSPRAAVLEVLVDAEEKPALPSELKA